MTLRAEDGSPLELKIPIVLDREAGADHQNSRPKFTSNSDDFEDFQDHFEKDLGDLGDLGGPGKKRAAGYLTKWIGPLMVILGFSALLVFGTFFVAVFVGMAVLLGVINWLFKAFKI